MRGRLGGSGLEMGESADIHSAERDQTSSTGQKPGGLFMELHRVLVVGKGGKFQHNHGVEAEPRNAPS